MPATVPAPAVGDPCRSRPLRHEESPAPRRRLASAPRHGLYRPAGLPPGRRYGRPTRTAIYPPLCHPDLAGRRRRESQGALSRNGGGTASRSMRRALPRPAKRSAAHECVSRPGNILTALTGRANAAAITSRISHTSFNASDACAQSLFWSRVLYFVEDPGDQRARPADCSRDQEVGRVLAIRSGIEKRQGVLGP